MEENTKKYFKYCLVPFCKSTSVKTPNKIFIRLPLDFNRRKKWLKACRTVQPISANSDALHVCEDHFNLEEDMQNYVRFKLMGGKKYIKSGIVPHIFDCQPDRKTASAHPDRITAIKRVKRQLVHPDRITAIKREKIQLVQDVASTSTSCEFLKWNNPSVDTNIIAKQCKIENDNQRKDVLTQTPKYFTQMRSIGVQCNLFREVSVSLSPHLVLGDDIGTSPRFKGIPTLEKSDSKSSTSSYIHVKCEYFSESD